MHVLAGCMQTELVAKRAEAVCVLFCLRSSGPSLPELGRKWADSNKDVGIQQLQQLFQIQEWLRQAKADQSTDYRVASELARTRFAKACAKPEDGHGTVLSEVFVQLLDAWS